MLVDFLNQKEELNLYFLFQLTQGISLNDFHALQSIDH